MDGTLGWGLEVIRAIQVHQSPLLTQVMRGLSFLGSEGFYLLILPLIYWTVDRRRGARIALIFLASAFVNLWLKDLLGQPRPFTIDPSVGMAAEPTNGLPSAHAQGSLLFWGLVAGLIPRPSGLIAAVVIPLLVGFSRVYLGVHFPTDVFAGWALGLLFIGGDALLGDRLKKFVSVLTVRWRLIIVAMLAFFMNVLYKSDVSIAGVFLGAGFGFAWASQGGAFSVAGSLVSKAGRYLLGIALTVAVYFLPKLVAPQEGAAFYDLVRFLRYALLGAWVAYGAPWLFLKAGLLKKD